MVTLRSLFFAKSMSKVLIVSGLISIAFVLDRHGAEFIAAFLELLFVLYAVFSLTFIRAKPNVEILLIASITIAYIFFSIIYAVLFKGNNLLDFLMIYKCFIYLVLLTFVTNKKFISPRALLGLFNAIYFIFAFKYLFSQIFGINDRPVVYMENNFELMFLYALYLIRYTLTKKHYLIMLFLLGIITLISLSRSSLLMYGVILLFVVNDSFKKIRFLIIPIGAILFSAIVIFMFLQRDSSLEEVDRFKFMLVLYEEIKDWNILQYLFGSERITALSTSSCKALSYYQNLFSYSGNGDCYSVILHSFLFRVLFDHGIVGLLFIIYATYTLLINSHVDKKIAKVFIAIVLINGLSVSSFNNLFFPISMLFLMTTHSHQSWINYNNKKQNQASLVIA